MSLKVDTRQSFDSFKHAGMYSNTVSLYTYILECPLEHSYMAIIVLCNKWISVYVYMRPLEIQRQVYTCIYCYSTVHVCM